MNSLPVRHSSVADRDIVSIVNRIASENITAAVSVAQAVEDTVRLLAQQPMLGERFVDQRLPELRRVLVGGYRSYSIYYQPLADHVQVVRVLHNSRDVRTALHEPM